MRRARRERLRLAGRLATTTGGHEDGRGQDPQDGADGDVRVRRGGRPHDERRSPRVRNMGTITDRRNVRVEKETLGISVIQQANIDLNRAMQRQSQAREGQPADNGRRPRGPDSRCSGSGAVGREAAGSPARRLKKRPDRSYWWRERETSPHDNQSRRRMRLGKEEDHK